MDKPSSNLKRSTLIDKLCAETSARESYVRATLNVLIPSQIKALRLRESWTQKQLGIEAGMKQNRISNAENPGRVAFTLDTLIRLAGAFRVGLQVRFVPFSEMLDWENSHSQDNFSVMKIENDEQFISPVNEDAGLLLGTSEPAQIRARTNERRQPQGVRASSAFSQVGSQAHRVSQSYATGGM